MYPDIDAARGHHALLKQIVDRHPGAATDYRALRRVLELCRRAAAAVDDRYCRDKLRLIEDFAAEMFSHSEHGKWDRDSISGAQFLKQQILDALELFNSRLYSLEAVRRKSSLKNLESLRT
jgi:phytoene dehydrogenase-like protein